MQQEVKALLLGSLLAMPLMWGIMLLPQKREPLRRDEICRYAYAQQTAAGGIVWTWKRNWACETELELELEASGPTPVAVLAPHSP